MSVRPVNPLVRCPRCSSRLISPLQADGCHDGVIVDRHCPECGHRDRVVTTPFAAAFMPDKVIDHTNLYWEHHTAPGRQAGTVSTDSVNFG